MTQSEHPPSRYESIARELAEAVSAGRLGEGERFSCRKLAHRYRVSAETARRAMVLLEERGVVRLEAGSGAVVLSRSRAREYMERQAARASVRRMQKELQELLEQRRRLDEAIGRATLHLLQYVLNEDRGKEKP